MAMRHLETEGTNIEDRSQDPVLVVFEDMKRGKWLSDADDNSR